MDGNFIDKNAEEQIAELAEEGGRAASAEPETDAHRPDESLFKGFKAGLFVVSIAGAGTGIAALVLSIIAFTL